VSVQGCVQDAWQRFTPDHVIITLQSLQQQVEHIVPDIRRLVHEALEMAQNHEDGPPFDVWRRLEHLPAEIEYVQSFKLAAERVEQGAFPPPGPDQTRRQVAFSDHAIASDAQLHDAMRPLLHLFESTGARILRYWKSLNEPETIHCDITGADDGAIDQMSQHIGRALGAASVEVEFRP
jgi:hypothetical protein